jgi:hypothetical protein
MDTWIVSRNPIGVLEPPEQNLTTDGTHRVSIFVIHHSYNRLEIADDHILLQSPHHGWAGPIGQPGHLRLRLAYKTRDPISSIRKLLAWSQGHALRLLIYVYQNRLSHPGYISRDI